MRLPKRNKAATYSDEELITGCRSGVVAYQEILYYRYSGRLMTICRRYAKTEEEAQDVFHDTFVIIFEQLHTYDQKGSFESWIKRICINTAINNYRKNKDRYQQIDITIVEEMTSTDESALSMLSNQDLMEAIKKLPEGYRMIFNLHAIEGYTHPEIAEMLNISVGTSQSQLYKAKANLKNMITVQTIYDYGNKG